jgi:molybdenum cofactor cytidylyltransferase
MGNDKLLLPYDGKSLLQHAIDLLAGLPVSEKILVTTTEKLSHIRIPEEIKLIINENPDDGQSESVKLGIKTATGDIFLFMNADQPRLTAEDIEPLLAAVQKNKGKIIHPSINGKPTTPTMFPINFRTELLALSGDTGGRTVRNKNLASCVAIEVKNPENFTDIDDVENYHRLIG